MRKLLCVPIMHTEADMGSLKESLRSQFPSQQRWNRHRQKVDDLWTEITQQILNMFTPLNSLPSVDHRLNYGQVRIYQDGLPVCGHELDIVRDLASRGSKNHQLVVLLVEKGATLEGTEDAALLLEEYNYIKAISQPNFLVKKFGKTEAEIKRALEEYREKSRVLLQKRDDFIAARIDSTLKDGEVGILFIGVMHEVEKKLPDDIQVNHLVEWHFSIEQP
ncbi:hypothetical protein FJZ31_38200 [Candidatus Poribacteria bacterium]|nr:hypothetical protein [Candidatus Poribacteria bacterium]